MHRTVITLTAAAAAKASTPQSSAALKKTGMLACQYYYAFS